MTTRRDIVTKCGAGLAAIIAAGKAPAALIKSAIGARNAIGHSLPYKKRVEYLQSDASAFINSGIPCNTANLKVAVRCKFLEFGAYASVFGSYVNETTNAFRIILTGSNNGQAYANCGYRASASHIISNFNILQWHDVLLDSSDDSAVCDGIDYSKAQRKVAGSVNSNSITLFAMTFAPVAGAMRQIDTFKMWQNNVLVRDFIPVIDWNDEPCMYDQVTKTRFYNQGTGSLVAGPDL